MVLAMVIRLLNETTVETVALLSKLSEAKHHIEVKVDMDELDLTSTEAKAMNAIIYGASSFIIVVKVESGVVFTYN
jgi:hypothetical protein